MGEGGAQRRMRVASPKAAHSPCPPRVRCAYATPIRPRFAGPPSPIKGEGRFGIVRRSRPTLIVFARAPAIGVGKTRLARDVGAVEAWRVYRAMSARLLRRLSDPRWWLVVRIAPDHAARGLGMEPQGRGDLGERLQRAIRAHVRGPVAVIGTDAPEVTPSRVWAALKAAHRAGVAFGPADDGGFWLLALSARRARRAAFPGVRWSSRETLADAERALGPSVRLQTLADVDDGAGLAAWRRRERRTLYRSSVSSAERRPEATASSVLESSPKMRR